MRLVLRKMDFFTFRLELELSVLCLWLCFGMLACTGKPEVNIPDENVMHYPHAMALNGRYLSVSSADFDGKYNFARLVIIDTDSVKRKIDAKEKNNPFAWNDVVKSNMLTDRSIGDLSFSDRFIVFTSRDVNQMTTVAVTNGQLACTDPMQKPSKCASARRITLPESDPFSRVTIKKSASEDLNVVSYTSSDRIDLVQDDGTTLSISHSFHIHDWMSHVNNADDLKKQRFVTRKMQVVYGNDPARAKVYFLVEQHRKKYQLNSKPKAVFILAVNVARLIVDNKLAATDLSSWNLLSIASLASAQDFFVNEKQNEEIIVLGRMPEMIYKIDTRRNFLADSKVLCRGTTLMAVDVDQDLIVVPCSADNRVAAFSARTLELKALSPVLGRGPSVAVIDHPHRLIYCSFGEEGFVAVLDDEKLNYLGHIFDKAPINREGS